MTAEHAMRELWGICCPDCGPQDYAGIVRAVIDQRDRVLLEHQETRGTVAALKQKLAASVSVPSPQIADRIRRRIEQKRDDIRIANERIAEWQKENSREAMCMVAGFRCDIADADSDIELLLEVLAAGGAVPQEQIAVEVIVNGQPTTVRSQAGLPCAEGGYSQ